MLAAHRDRENAAFQTGGAKPPGTRFPKTPLKIPLNDENAKPVPGGKGVPKPAGNNENLGTIGRAKGLGKSNMITPLGTRSSISVFARADNRPLAEPRTTRAPLGNKTTNAKARAAQPKTGVKNTARQTVKTQVKATTTQQVKQGPPKVEIAKLEIHDDKNPLEDEDVEYAPPPVKSLPYESDVLPENLLTFEGLKKENMLKGYYQYYYQDAADNEMASREKEMEKQSRRTMKRGDDLILKDIAQMDWSVRDVLETDVSPDANEGGQAQPVLAITNKKAPVPFGTTRQPSTLSSRRAASALSMTSQQPISARSKGAEPLAPTSNHRPALFQAKKARVKPTLSRMSSAEHVPAVVASRSTIGYRKGRSALDPIHVRNDSTTTFSDSQEAAGTVRVLARSASTTSAGSDATITPARYAQSQAFNDSDFKRLEFLSIFDVDEEDDDLGRVPASFDDEVDEDFELQINV